MKSHFKDQGIRAMNPFKYLYAITLLTVGLELTPRIIQKSISIDYREELIDGIVFTYRGDLVDGNLKQSWTVDGKKVDRSEYDEAILVAEMAERRAERIKEYEQRMTKREFQRKTSKKCYEKLLKAIAQELDALLSKFTQYRLESYIVFSQDTITGTEELEKLKSEIIPLLNDYSQTELSFHELQQIYQALKDYPDRLQNCFHKTIYQAVDIVDDTKQLKELLGLLAEQS